MTMEQMTAYLADDESLIRNGIAKLIPWAMLGLELTGTGADGLAAYGDIIGRQPDIVITDIKMPKMDGIELIRRVSSELKHTRFIVLSGHGEFELAAQAMRYGVKHYLLKPCDEQEIIDVLRLLIEEIRTERTRSAIPDLENSLRTQLLNVRSVEEVHQLVHSRWSQDQNPLQIKEDFTTHRLVSRMKQVIEENLGEHELSLQWLSQHYFFLHPEYLGKLFRKETQQRYTVYLNTRRMELAKELMTSFPEMRIYEIAERTGFGSNQQYFGSVFKKIVGVTPLEYKKNR